MAMRATNRHLTCGWANEPPCPTQRPQQTRDTLPLRVAIAALLLTSLADCKASPRCPDPQRHTASATTGPQGLTSTTPPENAVNQQLMLALSQAKNLHHKAGIYLTEGNLDAAIIALQGILSVPFPQGAPEADDVRFDARARLAKLFLQKQQLQQALAIVDEGLAQAQRKSFFVANLYTVQGEIYEAQAQRADTTAEQAAQARRRAIAAYDESIAINAALQRTFSEAKP